MGNQDSRNRSLENKYTARLNETYPKIPNFKLKKVKPSKSDKTVRSYFNE